MTRPLLISAIAATAFALPATASAQYYQGQTVQSYEDCERSDDDDQVIGGLLGGVLGGVVGNEVGGDAGAVIGGVGGAVAGAKIGDKDCENRIYGDRRVVQPNTRVMGETVRYDQSGNRIVTHSDGTRTIYPAQSQTQTRYYDPATGTYYYK